MRAYRVGRVGCGGLLFRAALLTTLLVAALICVANRSWFEDRLVTAMHGDRPKIHLGARFEPGATVTEDGVRQTAVLIDGAPHVRVESPNPEWRRHHKDARCKGDICTAAATHADFRGGAGLALGGLLAALLAGYIAWTLIVGDHSPARRH
jgi:hypothetical protein